MTKGFILLPAALCIAIVSCAPSYRHVVHERRDRGSEWQRRDMDLDRSSVLPTISIGLAQQNLELGEQYLMDVSDPSSENYGKHWSPEEVVETFAPSDETIFTVKSWLLDAGISEDRVQLSLSRNWLRMNLTIAEAESLLKTEYRVFEHKETSKRALAVEEYSVPQHVQRHIDYITPTLESTTITKTKPRQVEEAGALRVWEQKQLPKMQGPKPGAPTLLLPRAGNFTYGNNSHPALHRRDDTGASSMAWNLSICGDYVTRACIQYLYNIPNNTQTTSSLAVFEMFGQSYVESDLEVYLYNLVTADNWSLEPTIYVMNDTQFIPGVVGGATSEGDLDVQVAQGLVYPLDIWWYQTLNTDIFFDAVDSTYCATIKGGPCGGTPLASVISVSWGWYELPGNVPQARVCNEFMKIGLLGTTVLFSAGDSGVGAGSCTTFKVLESASCPYITSVGATMLAGSSITGGEVVANPGYWSTGGGFSNIWPLPAWQKSAVASYYKSYNPGYTSAQYNNTEAVRGYPDLVAVGSNIMVASGGVITSADGTSASSPIVASLITLINQERLAVGKSTVGFINPVLYSNPKALNDITSGDNYGCGTNGFTAVPGWDPVSGLGSPDYNKLLKVWLALP